MSTPLRLPLTRHCGEKFVGSHSAAAWLALRRAHAGSCPKLRKIRGRSLPQRTDLSKSRRERDETIAVLSSWPIYAVPTA
jgi:hypothetical protein